ncbi:MBL fold metallo-hydrolase [Nocardia sp. XZ_19_385]|uniref:MBL fold metallo-hydrolase n=1 Tax=Nocardia sp. XZ_19_385 TaxID=2769488 RepID=UPI00188F70EC|nr:MBL fold metallo-hydrolase [Nocardia sp. XZ_19_385]
MIITHYGHACVLLEIPSQDRPTRLLIDPGTYSTDYADLRDLDAILITHAHPDHLDVDGVTALVEHNPNAQLLHGRAAEATLAERGTSGHVVDPGATVTVREVEIIVTGGAHACIHPDLPGSENIGYLIADTVFHPGDSFDLPPRAADTVLVPAGGPWMKIAEAIDYLRAAAPRIAIPIHQAGLAPAHQQMHHGLLRRLAPEATEVLVLDHATPHTVSAGGRQ